MPPYFSRFVSYAESLLEICCHSVMFLHRYQLDCCCAGSCKQKHHRLWLCLIFKYFFCLFFVMVRGTPILCMNKVMRVDWSLGSQPIGDISNKASSRLLLLLSARPAVSYLTTGHHYHSSATKLLYCLVTDKVVSNVSFQPGPSSVLPGLLPFQ